MCARKVLEWLTFWKVLVQGVIEVARMRRSKKKKRVSYARRYKFQKKKNMKNLICIGLHTRVLGPLD